MSKLVWFWVSCCLFGFFLVGCDIPTARTPETSNSVNLANLLPYQGPVRSLFDDEINPTVFGTPDERGGEDNPRLLERIRTSTLVVVAQVVTVTNEGSGQDERLELELRAVNPPFRDTAAMVTQGSDPLKVSMGPGTASFALARSNQSDLIGKRLILCLGQFLENGKAITHWHGMADSPKVRQSVTSAASVADLEK
ncbi:MAG: hypothetical protein QM784_15360 [Polyangiaceae bacterium]